MESTFNILKTSRLLINRLLDKFSPEQLNKIPTGFNNNLIWHLGHIVVTQQSIIYKSANLPMYISDELFEKYMPGTKPTAAVSEEEIATLRQLLIALPEKAIEDWENQRFETFNQRTTGTGFYLGNQTDAFAFANYHEALHLGYMMSMARLV